MQALPLAPEQAPASMTIKRSQTGFFGCDPSIEW
jgi:hypothetical protein